MYPTELDEEPIAMIDDLTGRRGKEDMAERILGQASELWSYMSRDDGAHCALCSYWQVRQSGLMP